MQTFLLSRSHVLDTVLLCFAVIRAAPAAQEVPRLRVQSQVPPPHPPPPEQHRLHRYTAMRTLSVSANPQQQLLGRSGSGQLGTEDRGLRPCSEFGSGGTDGGATGGRGGRQDSMKKPLVLLSVRGDQAAWNQSGSS